MQMKVLNYVLLNYLCQLFKCCFAWPYVIAGKNRLSVLQMTVKQAVLAVAALLLLVYWSFARLFDILCYFYWDCLLKKSPGWSNPWVRTTDRLMWPRSTQFTQEFAKIQCSARYWKPISFRIFKRSFALWVRENACKKSVTVWPSQILRELNVFITLLHFDNGGLRLHHLLHWKREHSPNYLSAKVFLLCSWSTWLPVYFSTAKWIPGMSCVSIDIDFHIWINQICYPLPHKYCYRQSWKGWNNTEQKLWKT